VSSILILGTFRQTLTIIRSAVRSGHRIVLGINGDTNACEFSRYVDDTWNHPPLNSARYPFIPELSSFLFANPDISMIFPVGETELKFFAENFESIHPRIRLLMCNPETVRLCLHKPAMFKIVDELEIPQARYAVVSDCESLFSASDLIGYPCVVKPPSSDTRLSHRKALIFDSGAMIRKELAHWPTDTQSLVIQKYIPGPRHNIYFYAIAGRIEALAAVRILRTDRLDGTGLAVQGITVTPNPILVDYCHKITARLNYHGAGCAQFLVDEANDITSFLELNPRLGANFAVVHNAGLDLPLMMITAELKSNNDDTTSLDSCKVGVRYAWITGDLVGLKNAIVDGQHSLSKLTIWLFAVVKSALTSSVHITWDWRDPLPTIVMLNRKLLSFLVRSK